jgi:PadR family transcriptional regulator PadR
MERNRRPSAHTLLLLEALNKKPRKWQYGYELSQVTGLKSGTLYPILMRLSGRGQLESQWQPAAQPGRPPRHMYRLTAVGEALARATLSGHEATNARGAPAGGFV